MPYSKTLTKAKPLSTRHLKKCVSTSDSSGQNPSPAYFDCGRYQSETRHGLVHSSPAHETLRLPLYSIGLLWVRGSPAESYSPFRPQHWRRAAARSSDFSGQSVGYELESHRPVYRSVQEGSPHL